MKKKEQGILTVEASIVLTLCLLFILFLFSFARVYNAQSLVSHAVIQSTDAVALESYLREEALTGSEADIVQLANRFLGTTSMSADSFESLRSANVPKIAKEKFVYAIGDNEAEADARLKKLGVKNGLAGVDFSASRMDLGNDDVIVYVSYTIEMQFPVFGMDEITVTKASKAKTFGDILFGISVVPEDPLMGSASGSGSYKHGTQIQISATPSYGYKFVRWADGNTDNPRTITVTGEATYTAQFEPSEFGINLKASPEAGGAVYGGGSYTYLTSDIAILAEPAEGYKFVNWTIYGHTDRTYRTVYDHNPKDLIADQTYTCTAHFEKKSYTVNVETLGTTSGRAFIVYNSSNNSNITAPYQAGFKLTTPQLSGYKFLGWKVKGASSYFSTSLSVSMNVPAENITYVACYESTIRTVNFYNYDGSLFATRQVHEGNSLGSDMPGDPKQIGQKFGGWRDFNRDTRVYSDTNVYGAWSTCTSHRIGDCGVVHTISPVKLNSHKSPGKTYQCMCIVCADCGCYLKQSGGRWVKANGKNWNSPSGKIFIAPNIWCIRHQWASCESYKNKTSNGTYYIH